MINDCSLTLTDKSDFAMAQKHRRSNDDEKSNKPKKSSSNKENRHSKSDDGFKSEKSTLVLLTCGKFIVS